MTDPGRSAIIDKITRARPFGYLHLLLTAIAGAVVGVVLWQMIPWTGSYEECMLREMRGQATSSIYTASTVCRRRHPEAR
jgi:hypothetical protein